MAARKCLTHSEEQLGQEEGKMGPDVNIYSRRGKKKDINSEMYFTVLWFVKLMNDHVSTVLYLHMN